MAHCGENCGSKKVCENVDQYLRQHQISRCSNSTRHPLRRRSKTWNWWIALGIWCQDRNGFPLNGFSSRILSLRSCQLSPNSSMKTIVYDSILGVELVV